MKKFFMFCVLSALCLPLFSADIWEMREEISVEGVTAEKVTVVSDGIMKITNSSPNASAETLIDLNADKIVIVSHNSKTSQTIKLSAYIGFAKQLFSELQAKTGNIDPEKVIPNVTFEKVGNETVGKWNCEVWNVVTDGKPYSKVWVTPELKNQQLIDFKKKFSSVLPENLTKYRSIDAKIEDNFVSKGMIVKSVKLSQNVKMPEITITVKDVKKSPLKAVTLEIPAGYADKSTPGAIQSQTK